MHDNIARHTWIIKSVGITWWCCDTLESADNIYSDLLWLLGTRSRLISTILYAMQIVTLNCFLRSSIIASHISFTERSTTDARYSSKSHIVQFLIWQWSVCVDYKSDECNLALPAYVARCWRWGFYPGPKSPRFPQYFLPWSWVFPWQQVFLDLIHILDLCWGLLTTLAVRGSLIPFSIWDLSCQQVSLDPMYSCQCSCHSVSGRGRMC